tara:strand:+ start:244 stop:663 length:420 start_codon:yes stop_codon:yes gene_type:complete
MAMIDALTEQSLEFQYGQSSGDNTSYFMFPDHTRIKCQLIDRMGNNIKEDGTPGNELVWCMVCDQRCFYSDILYWVIPLSKITYDENNEAKYNIRKDGESTRASLTVEPISKMDEETGKKNKEITEKYMKEKAREMGFI